MKNFVVLALMASCLVASSHSFILKEDIDSSLTALMEKKNDLVSGAKGVFNDLKESAIQKKEAAFNGIKAIAATKLGFITGIKDAKVALLEKAMTSKLKKLAAIRAAKNVFYTNVIEPKRDQLNNALAAGVAAISTQAQNIYDYKVAAKDQAEAYLSGAVRGAVSELNDKIAKKKELFHSLTSPASAVADDVVVVDEKPYKLHTFVSNEPPVIGKVYVPETPGSVVIDDEPSKVIQTVASTASSSYGPPAQSYGPPN